MKNKWVFLLILQFIFFKVHSEPIFVSLGASCDVGIQLKANNLRTKGYPFDWLLTLDYPKFIDLLENDFADFLDPQHLVLHWYFPPVRVINTRYNIDFSHDWTETDQIHQNLPMIQEKYQRRIDRFRDLANQNNKVFFIRSPFDFALGPPYPPLINPECRTITREHAESLRNVLVRLFPHLDFHLIIINYVEDSAPSISGIDRVLEFKVRRANKDIDFKNTFDLLIQRSNNGTLDLISRNEYISTLEKRLMDEVDTMLHKPALDTLWKCMEDVELNRIPGDFIETGVWKGGATTFMKGFLTAYRNRDRKVWVADSFAGFPPTSRSDETALNNRDFPSIVIPIETVKGTFAKYNLLDDQVCFLKGFFSQTLPTAPIEKLAILRLDGDLYESTMDALVHLYPKLSIGGYVIIDDFGYWPGCDRAVEDYRRLHGLIEPVFWQDEFGIYWKKTREGTVK